MLHRSTCEYIHKNLIRGVENIMAIQDVLNDVKSRVETASKRYQGIFNTYVDVNRKAFNVVTSKAQSLANTEIGAAKNIYAAARASFDQARKDGLRQVASKPADYVPSGRDQVVSAYKQTIDLLVKTGNELTDIYSKGYKSILDDVVGKKAKPAAKKAKSTTRKAPARKTTAKRTTTRKTTKAASSS